jgi:hypothetical protein
MSGLLEGFYFIFQTLDNYRMRSMLPQAVIILISIVSTASRFVQSPEHLIPEEIFVRFFVEVNSGI